MQNMYPGKVNSPQTELASAITDTDTTIPLLDASVLPDPPNICTIGIGEDAETVLYTGVSGNDLTGVTRGFQGAAKAWAQGTKVARLFTEYDYDALRQNILSHASRHAAGGPDEITPESIGAETPAGAQAKAEAAAGAVRAKLDAHLNDKNNPHNVTPEQIGAETPTGAQAKAEAAAGAVRAKLDAHLAENATEAHDGISILNDNIIVTVGDNGDFSTINEALNYLTTKYPAHKSVGNAKATIKLLSGFVMSEQVLVRGLNLGWIEIVGEDAETTIERSALTINFTIDDYGFDSFPAFGVSKGGILPIVGQLFVMDNSGDSENRHGIMAVDNSRASILTGCGVKNAGGHGIYAYRASIINAYGANASNAGTHGIYANQASIINANGANASNAGTHGIYANAASIISAWGADASGAGGRGVYANQASIINAIAANARKGAVDSAEDIYVLNGSIIKIVPTGDNQTIGGTNQDINTLTRNGIIFG